MYLIWITRYFTNRTLRIDYDGNKSRLIHVKRGAPQGSCMGPIMYIIGHNDLPQIFEDPTHVHAYVDDIAIMYLPSIYLRFSRQTKDIENRINKDLQNLQKYTNDWHQPLNPNKTEIVVYHRTVKCPKLNIQCIL